MHRSVFSLGLGNQWPSRIISDVFYTYNQPPTVSNWIQTQTSRTSTVLWENNQKYQHVLQMDHVACICEGLPQVPSPRYVPTWDELENDNIRFILQSACGDADVTDKEMQIIHREFINERDLRSSHPDSNSRLWNIDDLTDMGFNLTRFSPILTVGDIVPQTPVGSGTTTPVPTSTPRPSGGSWLHNSDLISNRQITHKHNVYNSFTGVVGQVELQNHKGPETCHKLSGTDNSTPTFDTTIFYPGEIAFRNQGTSTSPPQCVEQVETQILRPTH